MSSHIISMIAAFVLYLGGMIAIGWRQSRKMASSEDFFLGARSTGPWVTALSAEASDMSGWLLMGLPGVAYLGGMKEAFWTAVGLVAGTYLNWLLVAKRLRKYTIHAGDAITIPEFFTNRFKDKSHLISLVSVIFIIFFFTIYAASGFVACAKLFNSVFGIPYTGALTLGIVIILSYTIMGGYLAVCSTDFVQGTLMFIALVVTTVIGAVSLGGPAEAIERINALGANFLNPFVGEGFGTMDIISALGWGLGYFGMPHILVRFMGLRSNKEVRVSCTIAMVWVVIAFIGALLVGVFGKVYLAPLNLAAAGAQETVFIETLLKMFPGFIAGIFLCGILAAAMSTADSQLLVASSAFSRDIYTVFLNKTATEKPPHEPHNGLRGRRRCLWHLARPEQLNLRAGKLRMGRLRRDIRTPRAAFHFLERGNTHRGAVRTYLRRYHRHRVETALRRHIQRLRDHPRLCGLYAHRHHCQSVGQAGRRGSNRGIRSLSETGRLTAGWL